MELWQELQEELADNPDMVGWMGRNQPGPLEQLSGCWVVQANAWRSMPHDWEPTDWGPLEYREWGAVLAGEMNIVYRGRTYKIEPGQWYTFPQKTQVNAWTTRDAAFVFMWFAGFQLDLYAYHCGWHMNTPTMGRCCDEQRQAVLQMAKLLHTGVQDGGQRVQELLWRFFSYAQEGETKQRYPMSPAIAKIVAELDANPGGPLRHVKDLAAAVQLGEVTFRKQFVQQVGVPVMQYCIARRLQQAKQLLAGSQLGVAEIAVSVGFDDPKHFCRLFSRHEGLSPRAFRAQLQRRASES